MFAVLLRALLSAADLIDLDADDRMRVMEGEPVRMVDCEGRDLDEMEDHKLQGRIAEVAFERWCDARGLEYERVDESYDYDVEGVNVEIKSRDIAYPENDLIVRTEYESDADIYVLIAVDMDGYYAVVAGWMVDARVGDPDISRPFSNPHVPDTEELEKHLVYHDALYDPDDFLSPTRASA